MLHEILISLSGVPSPIWEQIRSDATSGSKGLQDYVAPPEHAMLQVLAHLSELHIEIKEYISRVSTIHPSIVCRVVASSISSSHLARFQQKILEVESSILHKDAAFVGGYQIVPLSTIVSEFAPWTRRLEWLLAVVGRLQSRSSSGQSNSFSSGAEILKFLQRETYTGYSDIEDMANELLIDGQKVWMRLAASWILYGKLQTSGLYDFFVKENLHASQEVEKFVINTILVPHFIGTNTADSILSIGRALNQLRSQRYNRVEDDERWIDPAMGLLRGHLTLLESLSYPFNASILEKVVLQIDQSISKNALSQLLPLHEVAAVLSVIWKFILLGRGEFAMLLIYCADERVELRQRAQRTTQPVRKTGRLEEIAIKEAEFNAILSKTLSELETHQSDDEPEEEGLVMARKLLRLTESSTDDQIPLSTLLPTPSALKLIPPQNSALTLFLSQPATKLYSAINAYLLSIRRAEVHLAQLWKLTGHRRCYPTPLGPPMSSTKVGQRALQSRRERENRRTGLMRQHWACSSKALYLLSELDGYFHGEVIENCWSVFFHWLEGSSNQRPSSAKSQMSRPSTGSSVPVVLRPDRATFKASTGGLSTSDPSSSPPSDPRVIATAHNKYLTSLHRALLLQNENFIHILKEFLGLIDHYVALFSRLQNIWQGLDLQEDDGVMDAFSNYAQDEKDVMAEMSRSRQRLENSLGSMVEKLKDIGNQQNSDDEISLRLRQVELDQDGFEPWKAKTLDRLIIKLNYLSGNQIDDDESKKGEWNLDDDE